MRTDDVLTARLERLNPTRALAAPDEHLLAHILDTTPPQAPRRRTRKLLPRPRVLAAAALVTVLVALAFAVVDAGPAQVTASRAFAAVTPAEGALLHVKTRTQIVSSDGRVQDDERTESWSLGEARRQVITRTTWVGSNGQPEPAALGTFEWSFSPDGTSVERGPDGTLRRRQNLGRPQPVHDPAATFRSVYARGLVRSAGQDERAGRTRDLFVAENGDAEITYAVDRDTALPTDIRIVVSDLRTGAVRYTTTTTVEVYEHLTADGRSRELLTLSTAKSDAGG